MRLLKFSIVALLMSAAFVSCNKEKDLPPPVSTEKTTPANEKSIKGLWTGTSIMATKSIPVHFSFNIKSDGKLDLLNASQQVTGSGTWTLNGNSFKAAYSVLSSGAAYSVAADLYNGSPEKFYGTWGYNGSDTGGGFWNMEKIN